MEGPIAIAVLAIIIFGLVAALATALTRLGEVKKERDYAVNLAKALEAELAKRSAPLELDPDRLVDRMPEAGDAVSVPSAKPRSKGTASR